MCDCVCVRVCFACVSVYVSVCVVCVNAGTAHIRERNSRAGSDHLRDVERDTGRERLQLPAIECIDIPNERRMCVRLRINNERL